MSFCLTVSAIQLAWFVLEIFAGMAPPTIPVTVAAPRFRLNNWELVPLRPAWAIRYQKIVSAQLLIPLQFHSNLSCALWTCVGMVALVMQATVAAPRFLMNHVIFDARDIKFWMKKTANVDLPPSFAGRIAQVSCSEWTLTHVNVSAKGKDAEEGKSLTAILVNASEIKFKNL